LARRGRFTPSKHPRIPKGLKGAGRFTHSGTRELDGSDRRRAQQIADAFKPKRGVTGVKAAGYLEGIAATSGRWSDTARGFFSEEKTFDDVQATLRSGEESPAVKDMYAALVELPDDIVVSRRIPADMFGDVPLEDLVGMQVTDAAYFPASLTMVRGNATDVRMRVAVPAGTRAVLNPDTGELALDRGLDLAVTSVERNGQGGWDMYLVVLPKVDGDAPGGDGERATAPGRSAEQRPEPDPGERDTDVDEFRAGLMKQRVPELRRQVRDRGLRPGRARKSELVDMIVTDEMGAAGSDTEEPSEVATTPPTAQDIQQAIRDAVGQVLRDAGRGPGSWVMLAKVRDRLPETWTRDEVDQALVGMFVDADVQIVPESNQTVLTGAERAAAVRIGNQDKHLIRVEPQQDGQPATPEDTNDGGGPTPDLAAAEWHRDLSQHGDLLAAIRSGVAETQRLSGGATAQLVERVTYNDGTRAVVKQVRQHERDGHMVAPQADAEQLVAALGRVIGAPVPRALRTDSNRLVMDLVPGEVAVMRQAQMRPNDWYTFTGQVANSPAGMRLGLLDLLTQNDDRNSGNWLIQDGSVQGIDHGNAFGFVNDTVPGRPPQMRQSELSRHFIRYGTNSGRWEWRANRLSSDDVAWLRDQLEAVRPDFEAAGRSQWWAFASERLDVIGANARGTTNILAPEAAPAPRAAADGGNMFADVGSE
jgi:hypothetical protein